MGSTRTKKTLEKSEGFGVLVTSDAASLRGTAVALFPQAPQHEPILGDPAMTPECARTTEEVLRRVQGEFLEMPGLRLTQAQACRMWGLEKASCDALLGALVDAKFLYRTRDGAFMRLDHAGPVMANVRSSYRKKGVAA